MNNQIIEEIKRKSEKVRILGNGWCQFIFHQLHYVLMTSKDDDMIRISIPHVANRNHYSSKSITAAVNETNREVKYIKAVMLRNGSISLTYDHKINGEENLEELVSHIIDTLSAASGYLIKKIQGYEVINTNIDNLN